MRKALIIILVLLSVLSFSNYEGKASYYTEKDNRLNGHNRTSNGETYNENTDTCASNRHPFGTVLKVQNIRTGKFTLCRVNDRGGFGKYGRVIDLSVRGFKKIAPLKHGVVRVRVTVVK